MESVPPRPITLPIDVLHRIFSFCAPTYQSLGKAWRRRPDKEARDVLAHRHLYRLALVCRLWRLVAAKPDLWSTIEVDFETRRGLFAAHLGRCVVRSESVPLTLHIRARYPEECRLELDFLARESDRWRVANIDTDEEPHGKGWLSAIGKLPLLETLHIRPYPIRINITDVQAPRLTRVAAWNSFYPEYVRLPWAQLEAVYLRRIASRSLANVFKSFRPFRDYYGGALHLAIDNCDIDPSRYIPPYCAPWSELHITLREWCVQPPHTNAALSRTLSSLRLPCLHTLQLFSACQVGTRDTQLVLSHTAFLHFVEVSFLGDTLSTLSLVDVAIPESKLPECLAALPALTHLTLSDLVDLGHTIITDNVLRRLAVRSPKGNCTLLPRLTHFTCYTLLRFDDAALRDFVSARVRSTPATGNPTFTLTVYILLRRGSGERYQFGRSLCRFLLAHREKGELACKVEYILRAVDRDVGNAWASFR